MKPERRTVTDILEEIKLQLRQIERITVSRPEMFEACDNIRKASSEITKWATDWCKFIEEEYVGDKLD